MLPERRREGAPGQRRSEVGAATKGGGGGGGGGGSEGREGFLWVEASGVRSGCEFRSELEAGVVS